VMKPVPATYWDPRYGPAQVMVSGKGKKPGTLVIGTGADRQEVPVASIKFKYGPDSELFGIPYNDPYAGMNESPLRKIVASLLREVGEGDKEEEDEDSLDAQVDKFFLDYEKESRSSKMEGRDFRMMTRRFLVEAEEDEDKTEKTDDEKTETKKLTEDDLDVKNFLNSVMRLVDNYDALLDVRNTILARAVNFLLKGYEPAVATAFKESLMDEYGMEIGKSKSEIEDEDFQVPDADRAGPPLGG